MMRLPLRCLFSLGLALILALLGLSCGVSSSEPGHLEVRIRDHREAIGDFRELWLTISAIGIHPVGQPRTEGWIELEPSVQNLDLTQYTEGQEAIIAQTTVETGSYNAIRLAVARASGTLTEGQSVEVKVSFETVALNF